MGRTGNAARMELAHWHCSRETVAEFKATAVIASLRLWAPLPLLRPRQQESEQLGAALTVDDPVDHVGAEAALEGDHRFLLVGHVIAEAFEREEEAGVG